MDFDETIQRKTLDDLENIKTTYEQVCPVSENPWKDILAYGLSPNKLNRVKNNLNSISNDLSLFINKSDYISSLLKCSKLSYLKDFNQYLSNLNVIRQGLFVLENELPLQNIITNVESLSKIVMIV